MCIHRLLVGYECEREIPRLEKAPATDMVSCYQGEIMGYREEYATQAYDAADRLLTSLQGEIRHGGDPDISRQLRTQLSRWLKKNRSQCKSTADVV